MPYVEKGSIILIGATTENPSFEVNSALLSRCKVFVLKALEEKDLVKLLKNALASTRMEGYEVTKQTEQDCVRLMRGEISVNDLVREIMSR